MYVIKMNSDKTLTTTIKSTIYQNEKNADTLMFLVPTTYEDNNISECSVLLRYVLPNGIGKSEELEMKPETYKGYYQYHLSVTTKFTSIPGKIEVWLSAININDNLVLKSGTTTINVEPSKDISDYLSAEDMEQLDALSAKVALLTQNKADNIIYNENENYLQLTSNNSPIGNQISMDTFSGSDDVIDFDDVTISKPDAEDADSVIHF